MNTNEITEILKESAREGYSFNQYTLFGYPYKKMTKIARVKRNPDDNLTRIYHTILELVKTGYNCLDNLLVFLGGSKNDDFLLKEIRLLADQGLLEWTGDELFVTELGDLYLEGNYSIMVEDTMKYDYLVDMVSGEIFSCGMLHSETKKEPAKSIKPTPSIFNDKKIARKNESKIRDTFHHDFAGEIMLLDFIGDLPRTEIVWNESILAEYTCDDWSASNIPSYYTVRTADTLSLDKNLTSKFNTFYSQHIPSLMY